MAAGCEVLTATLWEHVNVQVLQRIRGIQDVDEEFDDIRAACIQANAISNPWREILKRKSRPQLFVAMTATFFQQARWPLLYTLFQLGGDN